MAWRHAYGEIFEADFIDRFVARNYDPERLRRIAPSVAAARQFFHVALDAERLVGFCQIADSGQGYRLYRIYLDPAWIGRGVGSRLLALGEEFLRARNVGRYFCYVHRDNALGRRFYNRRGFVHRPERDQGDEWCMEKRLDG